MAPDEYAVATEESTNHDLGTDIQEQQDNKSDSDDEYKLKFGNCGDSAEIFFRKDIIINFEWLCKVYVLCIHRAGHYQY